MFLTNRLINRYKTDKQVQKCIYTVNVSVLQLFRVLQECWVLLERKETSASLDQWVLLAAEELGETLGHR